MDTTFFTALCIFEVESPPIGQINFPAAFTAACYTSATKHPAMRRKFLDPRAPCSWTNGPGPWDQWIQGPRALGPVDNSPGTNGPWGPRARAQWNQGPRAQCARAAKHTSCHFLQFLQRNTRVTVASWARYRSVLSLLWCVSAHFHHQL